MENHFKASGLITERAFCGYGTITKQYCRNESGVMKKRETKSPIKNLPVRMPGQSLREQFDALMDEQVTPWLYLVFFAVFFAGMEWLRYYLKSPFSPWIYTILALVAIGLAVRKFLIIRPSAKALTLGRKGEEAVGQYLDEKLRAMGCQVLHDIPGDGFNLDHVVVGPTGVFCVETKTRSKPAKGECKVFYDGEKITVDGLTLDRDPIVQAKAQAHWLVDALEQSTGRRFFVQPIVLFPGWFVEQKVTNAPVWVLNEKGAPAFINNSLGNSLSPEDISLITFHLKRYIISTGAKPV